MKVKELLNSCTGGYFVIIDMNGQELISSTDTLQAISYNYSADGLQQLLEAEVAEFNIDSYHGHESALVIKISNSNRILTDSSELYDLLQQGAASIKDESLDDAAVLKAALDDFVAAVEKMATNESSAPELAAAVVVLYAIYKDLDRKE